MANKLKRILAAAVGLVPESDLISAQSTASALSREVAASNQQLTRQRTRITELECARAELERQFKALKQDKELKDWMQSWAAPQLAEMVGNTPCRRKTLTMLSQAVPGAKSLMDSCSLSHFRQRALWAVYWLLARTNAEIVNHARTPIDENTLSGFWCDALKKNAEELGAHISGIHIAYDAICRHIKPAIKEKAVGSDIVVMVGGKGMFPGGGYRMVWIQAKRSTTASGYDLDYLSNENGDGLQYEAIRKVEQPARCSFALYTLYSNRLDFIPAISVADMPAIAPETKAPLDLKADGCRFQDLLVGMLANPDMEHFFSANQMIDYLNEVGKKAPMFIIRIATDNRELELLYEVARHYYRELGIEKLMDRTPEMDYGQELGR